MHTLELLTGPGRSPQVHEFPGAWHELRPAHAPALALLVGCLPDEVHTRLLILRTLTGLPASTFAAPHGVPLDDLCTVVEAAGGKPLEVRFLPQLDWCFTPPDLWNPQAPHLPAKSLLPTVQLEGATWTGPADGLDNFTMLQFVWVDSLFQAFAADATTTNLHHLLGALYQPAHAAWRNEPIEEYGNRLARLPHGQKLAAVLNYRGLRAAVARLYPSVFGAANAREAVETSAGLFGMVYDVAAGAVFGPVQQVERELMHKVLAYVEHTNQRNAQEAARTPDPNAVPA